MTDAPKLWWRDGVIYQIYPRSFRDSNGDGVGDLRGITSRLDYLVNLGIDAVWISPFYPSPMADFGYDVSNYTDVDPLFGTLADFDALIASAHSKGLRVILDFVPNHTSSQHPWFVDSRSARESAKRDWYLWRDPAPDGGPPNNWQSNFGGSGWTFDPPTGQYFYHSFLTEQPDLNWRNPAVRAAMYAAMQFWLDRGVEGRGVDGFRMDVLWLLIKDDQFRSNPPNPDFTGGSSIWSVLPEYTANQPETLEIVHEMRALLDRCSNASGRERVLIGEIYLPIPDLVAYYGSGPQLLGAQMPFNFHLIQTDWQADRIAQLILQYEAALPAGAWPNWVLGNHDQKRLASRVGAAQARVAAVLLLTLRGTPTLYYGDELGMPDAHIAPDQVVDPAEKNQPGIGQGRDPERSPMLWTAEANAGFTAPAPGPGCRWSRTGRGSPSRAKQKMARLRCTCIAGCSHSGGPTRRSPQAPSRTSPQATASSPSYAARAPSESRCCSTSLPPSAGRPASAARCCLAPTSTSKAAPSRTTSACAPTRRPSSP